MTERLTTLPAVKAWLGISSTDQDIFLTRLIDSASQFALNYMNRDSFQVRDYTTNFLGNGRQSMLLANWPIVSITSVGVGGSSINSSLVGNAGLPGSGYALGDDRSGPRSLDLMGSSFYGRCQVIYKSGFRTTDTSTLPAAIGISTTLPYTPVATGQWTANQGVTLNGVAATKVISSVTPATGQYSVDDWGNYTFAAADTGKTAVITYDYVPFDVSWAVTELIGEWYKRKDRIGILSKTLGGQETITFSTQEMGSSIRVSLQPYMNVIPL